MPQNKNSIPKGFLATYRRGRENGVVYLPLAQGFLKLEYGHPPLLFLVSYVLDDNDDAIAIGMRLEMNLGEDGEGESVTWISENGVSGLQWSGGEVIWGHAYDDESPPAPGRRIGLSEWVDECLEKMINPSPEEIEERRRLDREDEDYLRELRNRKK
jgi:hypothetical protein